MAKRDKDTVTLGSGKIYLQTFSESMPTVDALCVESNLLGYIKGGASLEYTQETYEEKDDIGYVSKIITTNEEAVLKCGLLTWNGTTLKKLLDRCSSTEASGKRRRRSAVPATHRAAIMRSASTTRIRRTATCGS